MLTSDSARTVVQEVTDAASQRGFAVNVAVVDASGNLASFDRMDGALVGPIDVSIKKARTAALFGADSRELGAEAQPGGSIYTLEHTNGGLIGFGGGVLLREGGTVIGAVGVAGATVDADEDLAQIGASSLVR